MVTAPQLWKSAACSLSFFRNKGDVPQDLVSCKLAGWDRARQFRVQTLDKGHTCLEESVPEKEEHFSDDDVNALNSYQKTRSDGTLENTEVSPGGQSSC